MPADFLPGNYRYIPGVFQYSAGVAALPGYEIRRVRFRAPVPLAHGFERVAHYISVAGRPLTALCACELRSPAQFSEDGFRAFNETYVTTLCEWGLSDGRVNPVAQQRVSRDRSAVGAVVSRVCLYSRRVPGGTDVRDCRERRGAGRTRELCRAHRATRRDRP
jgi:hypothetical protein